MKHCSFLRRALPVAVLAAVLCTAGMPASALLSGGQNAAPAVSTFSKNGPITQEIAFTRADFRVEGDAALESVIVDRLPDAGAGVLTLGGQLLGEGDVVSMAAGGRTALCACRRSHQLHHGLCIYPCIFRRSDRGAR